MDDPEKEDIWRNRIVYSLPVREGLWYDELALQDEKSQLTAYKRDHCQLLIQRTRKMLRNLLRPTTLVVEAPYIMYGRNYLIKACDIPNKMNSNDKSYGLYLSGLITEKEIDYIQHFAHGCAITGSPNKSPCVRNTFSLVGADSDKDGQYVCYGDDFYIKIEESGGPALYVQCENSTIDNFGGHLNVRLSESPDIYCRFKIFHWNPQLRYETMGNGFQPNSRVIVQHTATGRNMAVEYTNWIPTFFGAECVVSCHTYRNSHKMETAENFWSFIGTEKTNLNLYVRAAKGEDIPIELINI